MRLARVVPIAIAAGALAVLIATGSTSAATKQKAAGSPIVIGAAIDLTKNMAPFDAPALAAAKIEIAKINAAGGVDGHPLVLKYLNDQLDATQTKVDATKLISQGVNIGWVTCDVDYATPAIDAFLQAKLLTVSPCIGTDQMGPSRFGSAGDLAFTFGNAAQDEGAAMAEWAYAHGWHSADVVTDKLLVYFQNVCTAFSDRFQQLGGKIVDQESFTQGDKTIGNVATRINGKPANMIAFCTSFAGDQPAFVDALRSEGNKTPIMNSWSGDGAYWWSKNPKVTNYYFVTYASIFGDDPNPAVNKLAKQVKAGTGGFITGSAAIDGIVTAIRRSNGSTNGATLAATLEKFKGVPTLSGKVSFSPKLHSVFGRQYRVIKIQNNKAHLVGTVVAKVVAKI
jgi:branched-chain amino acid transport system substrate-binding protein